MKALSMDELTKCYRALERALEELPETPSKEGAALVLRYAEDAEQLAARARQTFAASPNAPEAEIDALHAAMSDASGVLQRRFAGLVPPRLS